MNKLAQQNHGIMSHRIWNLMIRQIVNPIIHIILGIKKRLFDNLILAVQVVNNSSQYQLYLKEV